MNRQKDLHLFIFEIEEELPLGSGSLTEKYNDDRDENLAQSQISRDLGKLEEKGLVESPAYGKYDITEKGKTRADRILNPERYNGEEPEDFKDLITELSFYIDSEKEEKFDQCLIDNKPFKISLESLEKFSPEIVDRYEEEPKEVLRALDEVVRDLPKSLEISISHDLPRLSLSIPDVNDISNVGRPVKIEGTVEYATEPYGELVTASFQCTNCGEEVEKKQDSSKLKSPYKCGACGSRKFDVKDREFINKIEFRLSDATRENQRVSAFYVPEDMEKAVNDIRPGSRLEISGIVEEKSEGKNSKKFTTFVDVHEYNLTDKTFDLSNVEEEEFDAVRDKVKNIDKDQNEDHPFNVFSKSIVPHISGNQTVKEVVSASIFGASKEVRPDHVKHERIHSLIVGNPGTGKTDIVESALELLPKSYMSDASNSSGVGLTATVEKEDGGSYSLRAGRLVQADKGFLGLDELDKLPEDDEAKLNTALDKGTFPLDKASQHAKLPARTTVIGIANYQEEIEDNVNIPNMKPEFKESFKDRFALEYYKPVQEDNSEAVSRVLGLSEDDEARFSESEIRILVSIARNVHPTLTKEASDLAEKWYTGEIEIEEFGKFRNSSSSMRPIIHVIKVSCAFARARLSETVEERDMKRAIQLYCDANRN